MKRFSKLMRFSRPKRLVVRIILRGKEFNFDLSYLLENWGAPFVVAFMILLMTAAGYLCAGSERVANELAVRAYYCLVIGVVLQLVCYLKYSGEED